MTYCVNARTVFSLLELLSLSRSLCSCTNSVCDDLYGSVLCSIAERLKRSECLEVSNNSMNERLEYLPWIYIHMSRSYVVGHMRYEIESCTRFVYITVRAIRQLCDRRCMHFLLVQLPISCCLFTHFERAASHPTSYSLACVYFDVNVSLELHEVGHNSLADCLSIHWSLY